jgi:hypothetical protein
MSYISNENQGRLTITITNYNLEFKTRKKKIKSPQMGERQNNVKIIGMYGRLLREILHKSEVHCHKFKKVR